MGWMQGLKAIFVGEDEIDMEEYATYQPQKSQTDSKSQTQGNDSTQFESARQPVRGSQEQVQETPRQQPKNSKKSVDYDSIQPERQQMRQSVKQSGRQSSRNGRSISGQNNMRGVSDNRNNYQQEERNMDMSAMTQSSIDLVLSRPNNFRDVNMIGDDINAGKTVILNLEKVRQEEATRIIDFLSGVAYANQAEFKMLANKTYAIVPVSVNFTGVDLVSELENNGYNF